MPLLFSRQQRSHAGCGIMKASPNRKIICVLLLVGGEPALHLGLLSCKTVLVLNNYKVRWIALQIRYNMLETICFYF